MKVLTGTTRTAFICFFLSHVLFTLAIDVQAIAPDSLIPIILSDFLQWYATVAFNDPLMSNPKQYAWFQSFIFSEMIFQLPYFFIAIHILWNQKIHQQHYPVWFGPLCMGYGAHTATTLIPILTTLCINPSATILEKIIIVQVYLPYLLFPLWIFYIAAKDHIETYQMIRQKEQKNI